MPRKPIGNAAMTGAERLRRWRERKRAERGPTAETAGPSSQALAEAQKRILDLEDENAALRGALAFEFKQRAATAKPKAEKPALPPDEVRERRIKALTTEVQNLRAKLRHMNKFYEEESSRKGVMPFSTTSLIATALHPDSSPSDAEREKAFKAFSAWKADKNGAARRAD
jgi:hypothetical protein